MTAADLSCHACSNAWEWKTGFPIFLHLLIPFCVFTIVSISTNTMHKLLNVVVINMYLLQDYDLQLDIRSPFSLILMNGHFHHSAFFCYNAARNNTLNDFLMCVMKDLGDWRK